MAKKKTEPDMSEELTDELWNKLLEEAEGELIVFADIVPTNDRLTPFVAKTLICPFCPKRHIHGLSHGHRGSHCDDSEVRGEYYLYVIGLPFEEAEA